MKQQLPFREHVYAITIPNISGYRIHFVFSNDIHKSWLKRFNTKDREYLDQAAALHSATDGGHSWLFFKENVGVSSFVHECWHAVYALLKWAGIAIDNNELIAYTLGYVVSRGQTFQTLNDAKLKARKQ